MIEIRKKLTSGNELVAQISITADKGADVSNCYTRTPTEADLEEGRRIVDGAMEACGFDTRADEWRRIQ